MSKIICPECEEILINFNCDNECYICEECGFNYILKSFISNNEE